MPSEPAQTTPEPADRGAREIGPYRGVKGPWKGLIDSGRPYRLGQGKDQTRKAYVKGPCR